MKWNNFSVVADSNFSMVQPPLSSHAFAATSSDALRSYFIQKCLWEAISIKTHTVKKNMFTSVIVESWVYVSCEKGLTSNMPYDDGYWPSSKLELIPNAQAYTEVLSLRKHHSSTPSNVDF